MAKINYYIRSKKKGQPASLYLRFSEGRNFDLWIPTPVKIQPEHWSAKTQSFKQRIVFDDEFSEEKKNKIEDSLRGLKRLIISDFTSLSGKTPTREWIISVLDRYFNVHGNKSESLNQYIDRFIKEATDGTRLASSARSTKVYSKGSIRSFKDFQNSFDVYQGIYKESKRKRRADDEPRREYRPLDFDDIDADFYNDFVAYFFSKGCTPNYVGKLIKILKTLMRQSREEGLHSNSEIDKKYFKTLTEEVDSIYLNESEISRLFSLDLSKEEHLELARDVFLVGCYTAQRFSDYSRISEQDKLPGITGMEVLEIIQQKTREKCIIPIRPELEIILKKYQYNLPRTYEQKINEYIKKVGARAEINELIQVERNKGGLIVKEDISKCQLIKTHTARRSGCTNMYLAGIPVIDIMKISGHRAERDFMKYIKVTKEQTAISLADHSYFMGSNLKQG